MEIPVSFPDDEMMVERLGLTDAAAQAALWQAVLSLSHARGELFVLQLHPERFFLCADALADVLARARSLRPGVWLASLGEIAAWWQEKAALRLRINAAGDGRWQVTVEGPARGAVLVRGALPEASSQPFDERYARGQRPQLHPGGCRVARASAWRKAPRPSRSASWPTGATRSRPAARRTRTRSTWTAPRPRPRTGSPCWRGSRPAGRRWCASAAWPDGARSALAITGDIDALTLWDYGLRLAGR